MRKGCLRVEGHLARVCRASASDPTVGYRGIRLGLISASLSRRRGPEANGVAARLQAGEFLGGEVLERGAVTVSSFAITECGEMDPLDPERYAAPRGTNVIAELHDCLDPGISRLMAARLASSHLVVVLRVFMPFQIHVNLGLWLLSAAGTAGDAIGFFVASLYVSRTLTVVQAVRRAWCSLRCRGRLRSGTR